MYSLSSRVEMNIIKKTKRLQFKNEEGILCSEIKDSTTIESTEFYIEAPFPNYQGYENAHILQKIVSENIFLNDLKKKCFSCISKKQPNHYKNKNWN